MYQCERQCLKGILQPNIQSLEVWGEGLEEQELEEGD